MKRRKKILMKKTHTSVRLSAYVHPLKYKIKLKPDMETFTFFGEETIDILLEKSTKEITLHALELSITSAEFIAKSKTSLQAAISYNKKTETAAFTFPKLLSKGEGKLYITFAGIINDKMIGFYRSRYEVNGKTHHMATTQFESTHARRAFPCFDEPAKKAVFEVSLEVPAESTVIANTIESEIPEHNAGYKVVSFTPTPKMSTYLLAFIVGKFEHIESKTSEGTTVRVFTTPGKKHQAVFALETAARALEFYEDYFGIPYPLPVMDLIAIPDFAAGAMENWGAVTYRETALLVDEDKTSTANKQYVALVIAHELAHQWFGNLVTMEWWTHLWLNEGFASYIEYLAVDHIFPDWHIWTQFIALDHAQALEMDSLKHTHPIEVEVHHPDEINEIYDAVSYSKGASIIRMLASYLGEKDFARGLQHYLKKHSFANAKTQDLWQALEKISKKPVTRIMRDWTSKAGYPLITVKEKGGKLTLSQERFFLSPKSKKESKETTTWAIPLSIAASSAKEGEVVLLTKKSLSVPLHTAGYLKVNPKEVGFFRVAYPPKYLQRLKEPIAKKILSAEDRFGIIRDLFALSKAGEIPTTEALSLLPAYKDEEEYIVWVEIAAQLRELANLLAYEPFYEDLEKYNRSILSKITQQVGWEKKPKESHSQTLLRSVVLYGFGSYGDADTIKKAQAMLAEHIKGKQILPSDLRGAVYNLSAQNGDEKTYKQILQLYKKETLHEEKDRLLRALCLFKDKQLLKRTLNLAFSEHVRSQDAFRVIHVVWNNPKGRYLAWEFVQEKWDIILERFSKSHLIQRFIQPASTFTKAEDAAAVKAFFRKHKAPSAERTIAQVIEQIILQAQWFTRDKDKINTYLHTSFAPITTSDGGEATTSTPRAAGIASGDARPR